MPETKVRTSLVHIVHQADFLAARVEFEREWFPKFQDNLESKKNNNTLKEDKSLKKYPTKVKALSSIKSTGLKNVMDNFFTE